jgi:dCMP deaminase
VDKNNKVIASSCNNFPKRTKEGDFSWNRDEEWIDSKYPYVVHAELSTILKAHKDLTGCSLYVTLAPCNNCALAISQSGISKVYFLEDKYHDVKEFVAARKILEKSNIKVEQIKF